MPKAYRAGFRKIVKEIELVGLGLEWGMRDLTLVVRTSIHEAAALSAVDRFLYRVECFERTYGLWTRFEYECGGESIVKGDENLLRVAGR